MQRERLNLKWFLRSFRLLKEYYHIVLSKIVVVQAAADRARAGVCLCLDVSFVSRLGDAFNGIIPNGSCTILTTKSAEKCVGDC